MFEPDRVPVKARNPSLAPGNFFGIVKARCAFDRACMPNWTCEVFVVVKVLVHERPVVYTSNDLADELIDRMFNE